MNHGSKSSVVRAQQTVVAACLAAPLIVVFAGLLVVIGGWAVGYHPFWPTPEINLSQAVAIGGTAEVVRMLEAGHDANRRWPVRPNMIDRDPHVVTPLETAVALRRLDMLQLLIRYGGPLTPEIRSALVERAAARGATDIVDYLQRQAASPSPERR